MTGGSQHHHHQQQHQHHSHQQQQQQQHHHHQQQSSHHAAEASAASTTAAAAAAAPGPVVPAGVPITSPAAVAYFAAHPRRQQVYFGNYLLLQTLGEGEFGKVKLGVHREWGEEVAVKLIKRDKVAGGEQSLLQVDGQPKDPAKMTKVEREIQVLKDVRHPNIVRLYEVIESDRYIGIVLEYASGGELFDHILAHKYLREKDACRLFAQLISGVSYLHQKKIIHRDLKLENLLLDRHRNVIITDFGFANNFEDKRDDLMATSCGSPCYAAPELVVQDGLYAGSAVDVWSCGVILYAMLAGYLPFDDDPQNPDGDNINLLYKYIMATPLSFPDYISAEPRDLLSKMLVPDPLQRATLPIVMAHSWLAPYRDLFKFTVEELEHAAKEQQTRKRHAYRQQMIAQQINQEKARYQSNQPMGRSQTSADGAGLLLGAGSGVSGSTASNGLPLDARQQRHQSAMATTSTMPDNLGQEAARSSSHAAAHHGGRTTQRPTTAMALPTAAPAPFGAGYERPDMEILAAEAPAASRQGGVWQTESSAAAAAATAAGASASLAEEVAAAGKQPAGSKHQRHTIQLEYDSRTSPEAKRSASSRQSPDVVPPVPKVPRVESIPAASKPGASPGGVAATPANNAFVLDAKPTVIPQAEKQIEAEVSRAVPAEGTRTPTGGSGVPSPVTEVRTPPTTTPSKLATESSKTPQQKSYSNAGAAAPGSKTPTAASVAAATAESNFKRAEPNGGLDTISDVSAAGSTSPAVSGNASPAKVNGSASRGSSQQRPQTAMPSVRVPTESTTPAKSIATSSPPKSSESRATRHRKGLSTDKFFFSRLLGNSSNDSQAAATPSRPVTANGDDEEMENIMPPPSTTDIRRRDTVLSNSSKSSSSGRRKALSLVVSGGRSNEQSPASRDREKAKALAALKEKEKENAAKTVKEERRLTARFGRKDSSSQQLQPPSTPKAQTAGLPATSSSGVTPSSSLATPSVKGSIGPSGSSAAGSLRSPAFFDSADASTVGPSSSAAKKVMDWFRKKSLSKGTFSEQPPFDLDRSSIASATPSRIGVAPTADELATPSRVNGVHPEPAKDEGTPRLVVTGVDRSPEQPDSMPSSRSTSGTHSQGTHYTSSTAATTVPDSVSGAAGSTAQAPGKTATADDEDGNTVTPRATPSVAQAGASQVSLVRPFTDVILREHLGAVDQSALTSRPPPQVFSEVRKALYEMGIEVRKERDEEFKLECVRRKRAKTLLGATQGLGLSIRSSVFRPSEAEMERSAAKASANLTPSGPAAAGAAGTVGAPGAIPTTPTSPSGSAYADASGGGSGIRNFLRRGTITASSPPLKSNAALAGVTSAGSGGNSTVGTPGLEDPNAMPAPIYGEASVDGGQEVRFSVEITRIKNLPGLYSLDIRRMKGNLWAYKFIYHALLDRCQLAAQPSRAVAA
ncbi:hypothetical protein OC844_001441 [Tilletia horrida]|nr:hypothetical protein OC844_001441 [Tilletia horrida]